MSAETFHVRMEGPRVVRLTVAEMTPEDLRLAGAFAERELQLMQQHAVPALALLQRVAAGDRSTLPWELHRAQETVATLVRMQQQTDRLRAAVRAVLPVAV
jgi:hypothetical protein